MTLYHNPWMIRSERKKRRFWRKSEYNHNRVRANFAYGRQWKRNPHCRAMVELQVGLMTSTWVIPERSYGIYRESIPDHVLDRVYARHRL